MTIALYTHRISELEFTDLSVTQESGTQRCSQGKAAAPHLGQGSVSFWDRYKRYGGYTHWLPDAYTLSSPRRRRRRRPHGIAVSPRTKRQGSGRGLRSGSSAGVGSEMDKKAQRKQRPREDEIYAAAKSQLGRGITYLA